MRLFPVPLFLLLCACTSTPDVLALDAAKPVPENVAAIEKPKPAERVDPVKVSATQPVRASGNSVMQQAVTRAVSTHPSITEAATRVGQYDAEIDVARAGYFPRISGGINSSYDRRSDNEGFRPRATVQASQMVYDFGKVSSTVEIASALKRVQQAETLVKVDTIIRETAYAVIEVDRNEKLLGVARQQVSGVGEIAKLVRQRSASGASTMSDKVQADARLQAAQSRVLELSAQLARWQSTLRSLTGTVSSFSGTVVPASLATSCSMGEPDWDKVPAVRQALAQRGEAVARLSSSRANTMPTFSLDADAGYDLDGRSRNTRNGISSDEPEFTVGLNVRGDIYEGGANKARRNAASFALGAAGAARQTAQLEVLQALSAARSQTQGLNALQSSLLKRDGMIMQTRDLYKRQYVDLGTRTLLDLLNAEQELHSARLDRVNTRSDMQRLNVECLYNSGRARAAFGIPDEAIRGIEP